MEKKDNSLYIYLGLAAVVLFYTLRKKVVTETKKITEYFKAQTDPPSNTYQVYSKIGTKLYDRDGQLIYTYDTSNLGMTVIGTESNGTLNIVFGETFQTGLPAFVLPNEVQYI